MIPYQLLDQLVKCDQYIASLQIATLHQGAATTPSRVASLMAVMENLKDERELTLKAIELHKLRY